MNPNKIMIRKKKKKLLKEEILIILNEKLKKQIQGKPK